MTSNEKEGKVEKVSIIVPVHNAQEFLRECLDSIISQTYKNTEIILAENYSSDKSAAICEEYARKYDNVFMYRVMFDTPGEVRNFGTDRSHGEYIMYVDADDYLFDDTVVEEFVKCMQRKDGSGRTADVAVGNYRRLWRGRLLETTGHGVFSGCARDSCRFRFEGFFSVGTLSYAWAKMYRRSFLLSRGIVFGNYRYAEDKMYNYMCYINGAVYTFSDKDVYVYRRNEKSISNTYRENGYRDWIRIAEDLDGELVKKGKESEYFDLPSCTIFFAAFFDAKNEYVHSGRRLKAVRGLLRTYASYELPRRCFKEMSRKKSTRELPSFTYRLLVRAFALLMRFRCYGALALGVKLLVDLRIDERLSDTGKRS